jgi:hypothetical protein
MILCKLHSVHSLLGFHSLAMADLRSFFEGQSTPSALALIHFVGIASTVSSLNRTKENWKKKHGLPYYRRNGLAYSVRKSEAKVDMWRP